MNLGSEWATICGVVQLTWTRFELGPGGSPRCRHSCQGKEKRSKHVEDIDQEHYLEAFGKKPASRRSVFLIHNLLDWDTRDSELKPDHQRAMRNHRFIREDPRKEEGSKFVSSPYGPIHLRQEPGIAIWIGRGPVIQRVRMANPTGPNRDCQVLGIEQSASGISVSNAREKFSSGPAPGWILEVAEF